MLAKEKYSMKNLKTNNKFNKFIIIIVIYFSTVNVFSEQNDIIENIEKNWNETQTLTGQFHQKIGDNKIISGDFFIEKPYKSNFTYYEDFRNIITSQYFINVVDKQNYLIDRYPIINQPLYKMFSKDVSLSSFFNINYIEEKEDEIIIKLVSKSKKNFNSVKITLTFNSEDYLLKNWEIIDALEQTTYLEFTNIRKNISIDQNLFIFKERIE